MNRVYVVGTCDTKATELDYVRACIEDRKVSATLVDVSTRRSSDSSIRPDVTAAEVAAHHPGGGAAVFEARERGGAISAMAQALAAFLASRTEISCHIGIGGSGHTALVTEALRAMPVGLPQISENPTVGTEGGRSSRSGGAR